MRLALVRILVFGAVVHLASPIALWNVAVSSDCKVYMAKKSVAKFRRLMKNVVVPAYDPDAYVLYTNRRSSHLYVSASAARISSK